MKRKVNCKLKFEFVNIIIFKTIGSLKIAVYDTIRLIFPHWIYIGQREILLLRKIKKILKKERKPIEREKEIFLREKKKN